MITSKSFDITQEQLQELERLSRPLMKFLERYNPMADIIISTSGVTVTLVAGYTPFEDEPEEKG